MTNFTGRIGQIFQDKRLESKAVCFNLYSSSHGLLELASLGIGVHHAGLNLDDRRATEELFLDGNLRVIVATSVSRVFI